jgi:hypothetical protein
MCVREWIADAERPAEQFRGRYQLRLEEARSLIAPSNSARDAQNARPPTAPGDEADAAGGECAPTRPGL